MAKYAEKGSVDEQRNRLSRLAGQLSGIARMLEERRPTADILLQFKAVRSALDAIEERVIHLALRDGIDRALAEESQVLLKGRLEELFNLHVLSARSGKRRATRSLSRDM